MKDKTSQTSSAVLKLTLKCDLLELQRAAEEIEAHGGRHGWPRKWIYNTNLSVDELVTNVVLYGFDEPSKQRDIELTLSVIDSNLVVEIIDQGAPFNPFEEVNEPTLDAPLEERQIGGLGVHFVKSLVSETSYQRIDDKNCITLVLYPPD